ncbi:LacI family DNA-binding transcriptional regulator [Alteromonadaceae bacterium BrNp21-10]|nr:LacI family DNA-binding transcriptional regulator [Alteromonadaceae bacterium BrNp21-10]
MATIRDVSKESGLSIATVSRAISNPEKVSRESLKKVQKAIDKLQYQPNMLSQKFRNKRSNTIVILVPNISNLFFAKVISGIEDVAQKNGYNVLLGDTRNSHQRTKDYVNLVETRQADGIIQLRPHYEGQSVLPCKNVLAVNAGGCEFTPYPSVRIDNVDAAEKVISYLIDNGHKRIGVISGMRDNPHTRDRLKGYKQGLANAGIAFDDNLIAEGDFTLWSGMNAVQHFVQMPDRPSAIFCMNDEMAIGAIKGLKEKNIQVPGDISITGFDNLDVSNYCDPPLTTVSQPAIDIGEKAAELLFQLIHGEEPAQTEYVMPHEFVVRQSSGIRK